MPHPADFVDAHRCHWADAELLFGHALWANADLLYGFSAECGLKAVMTTLGMPVGGLAAGASLIELEATPVFQAYRDFPRHFDGLLTTGNGGRG